MSHTNLATTPSAVSSVLSNEIRDGLLQDLVAVGLILRLLEQTAAEDTRRRLAFASAAIDADVRVVRDLIERLRVAA